jgi:hypothetical protein
LPYQADQAIWRGRVSSTSDLGHGLVAVNHLGFDDYARMHYTAPLRRCCKLLGALLGRLCPIPSEDVATLVLKVLVYVAPVNRTVYACQPTSILVFLVYPRPSNSCAPWARSHPHRPCNIPHRCFFTACTIVTRVCFLLLYAGPSASPLAWVAHLSHSCVDLSRPLRR